MQDAEHEKQIRGKERDVFGLDVGIGPIVHRDAGRKN